MARNDNDKRKRLVQAANELIYQNGFNTTTLADIAKAAGVPLGNVYYYFKTKDSILDAVINLRTQEFQELFSEWNSFENVKARIMEFIKYHSATADQTANYGCSTGSLCQELGKSGGQLANQAAKLLNINLSWLNKQFAALNKAEQAQQLAEYLMIQLQGLSLLSLTFKDPQILNQQQTELNAWVEAL